MAGHDYTTVEASMEYLEETVLSGGHPIPGYESETIVYITTGEHYHMKELTPKQGLTLEYMKAVRLGEIQTFVALVKSAEDGPIRAVITAYDINSAIVWTKKIMTITGHIALEIGDNFQEISMDVCEIDVDPQTWHTFQLTVTD